MVINIFNQKMSYDSAFEFYCFENCYRLILQYYGVKNGGLYIDAALNLLLQENDPTAPYGFSLLANTNRFCVLPAFQDKVKVYKMEETDPYKVWLLNKQAVDNGIPLITGVDVYYLSYQSNFQKIHGAHGVILCGYDEAEKMVKIIDWYEPWFFRGQISLAEYLQARSSRNPPDGNIFSGITIGNAWSEFERDGWEANSAELLHQTLELSMQQYYGGKAHKAGSLGITALKKLLRIIEGHQASEVAVKKDFLSYLHKNLYRVSRRKWLFKYYLETVNADVPLKEIPVAVACVAGLIAKWDRVHMLILKASLVKTEELYPKISVEIAAAMKMEENFYDILQAVAARL